jgi:hypothetical protein
MGWSQKPKTKTSSQDYEIDKEIEEENIKQELKDLLN